jgi:outer membrane lipoprotein-sorting protein
VKLSDFRTAGQDKIDGRQATVIRFTLTRGVVSTYHRLWLDAETGLPLKLAVQTPDHMGVIETYRNWKLDPQVPDATFAIPKD